MNADTLHCTVSSETFCNLNKRFLNNADHLQITHPCCVHDVKSVHECATHKDTTSKLHIHVVYMMSRVYTNVQHTKIQHLGRSQQHGRVFLEHSSCSSQIISQLWVLEFLLSLGSLIHQLRGIAAKCLYVIKQL
jgi:hypothetical protein